LAPIIGRPIIGQCVIGASLVWNPHRLGLIKDLELVQICATKLVISIKNFTYKDRLKRLKLPTLKYRSIRGDD